MAGGIAGDCAAEDEVGIAPGDAWLTKTPLVVHNAGNRLHTT
jgi:hypothetical protein